MKTFLMIFVVVLMFFPSMIMGNEKVSAEEFVARARRSNGQATYARLYGVLQYRSRNRNGKPNPVLTMPIYFGTIIHPDRAIAQLILDDNEGYMLSQAQGSGVTTVKPMRKDQSDKLGKVGVRASDLVMSFLFCKVEKEFDSELLRGMIKCRVFLLDDEANKEKVKVWISSEHAFPLKAEFYKYGESSRYRELEASALTKKNDLYYVRRIRLEGDGWVTRIDFSADKADVNLLGNPPQNVFIPLKK